MGKFRIADNPEVILFREPKRVFYEQVGGVSPTVGVLSPYRGVGGFGWHTRSVRFEDNPADGELVVRFEHRPITEKRNLPSGIYKSVREHDSNRVGTLTLPTRATTSHPD
jgi:hypothetical protein